MQQRNLKNQLHTPLQRKRKNRKVAQPSLEEGLEKLTEFKQLKLELEKQAKDIQQLKLKLEKQAEYMQRPKLELKKKETIQQRKADSLKKPEKVLEKKVDSLQRPETELKNQKNRQKRKACSLKKREKVLEEQYNSLQDQRASLLHEKKRNELFEEKQRVTTWISQEDDVRSQLEQLKTPVDSLIEALQILPKQHSSQEIGKENQVDFLNQQIVDLICKLQYRKKCFEGMEQQSESHQIHFKGRLADVNQRIIEIQKWPEY